MVEADRLAIEDFGIGLLQMMEHAGSRLAELTQAVGPPGRVAVLAGGGNNGGGGLSAARHLANRGRDVTVVLAASRLGGAARHHLATLDEMRISRADDIGDAPLVVDAMVGYGLQGPLRARAATLAQEAAGRFVVSLDFPSGHGATGSVAADATLTLALPKEGLRGIEPLYLADLGLPAALWRRMGLTVGAIFERGGLVRVVD